MSGVRRLFALIFSFILLTINANAEDWHELTSEHFILRTDTNIETARKTIEDLEKYRFTIGAITGLDLSNDYSPPLVIYAYDKTKAYLREVGNAGTAGFYLARERGAVSALTLETGERHWDLGGLNVIFHEYSHHILHQYSPVQYPRWYDEGLGEYLGTMEFDGNKAIIGKPAGHRLPLLKSPGSWVRFKELMRATGRYLSTAKTDSGKVRSARGQQYAQGWLVTHFLQSKDEYQQPLQAYFNALNTPGTDNDDAFKKAFGKSFSKMDKEVKRYWYDRDLVTYSIDLSDSMPEIQVAIRTMSQVEADAQNHEIRHLTYRHDGKEKKASAAFQAAFDADVRRTDMAMYLADLALYEDDWDEANKYVEALLTDKPDYAPALVLKTYILAKGKPVGELEDTVRKAVRRATIKALKADQSYVPGLMAYARLFMDPKQKVSANALDIIETIRFLAPDVDAAKVLHVRLLAKTGDVERAKYEAQKLVDWASSNRLEKRYEKLLAEISKRTLTKTSQ